MTRAGRALDVFVAGATGYIGRVVVAELVARGHRVVCLARERAGIDGRLGPAEIEQTLTGAEVRYGDVTDPASIREALHEESFDAIVSCLASRTGGIDDSWRIDYSANRALLDVTTSVGIHRFVLLSAICVQHPQLAFQRAKLAFEAELAESKLSHAIVRPTAFFKSLAGQVPRVKAGKPFLLFGPDDGPACKPISERDLARFMAACLEEPDAHDGVLPVGGPGGAVTPRERGEMLFELLEQPARFRRVPLGLFGVIIPALDVASRVVPSFRDKAEFARIGRFYATEPMLWRDPSTGSYDADATPSFGTDTLRAFYEHVIVHGLEGQELGDQGVF